MVKEYYHVPLRNAKEDFNYMIDWNAKGKMITDIVPKAKIMIDCGAYTFFTRGVSFDMEKYIKFLNDNDNKITWFVSVDVIPGKPGQPPTEEESTEAENKSKENFEYLVSKVNSYNKIMPVVHANDVHIEELVKYYCEFTFPDGSHLRRMCCSRDKHADNAVKLGDEFYTKFFYYLTKYNKYGIEVHALGEGGKALLAKYDFTSADSSRAVRQTIGHGVAGTHLFETSHVVDWDMDDLINYNYDKVFTENCEIINRSYVSNNTVLSTVSTLVKKTSLW